MVTEPCLQPKHASLALPNSVGVAARAQGGSHEPPHKSPGRVDRARPESKAGLRVLKRLRLGPLRRGLGEMTPRGWAAALSHGRDPYNQRSQ